VVDDRVPWVAEVARVGGSAALGARDLLGSWRAATAHTYLPGPSGLAGGGRPLFGRPERAELPHEQRHTADSLTAKIATHAGLLVMPEAEREQTLDRIRAALATGPETAAGVFALPMLTGVLRVRPL